MAKSGLFSGLIIDDHGEPVEEVMVGGEAFYVVDDDGFQRHIETEQVDRQVLQYMADLMEGREELISESAMKMLGQEDIFTKAVIDRSLSDMESEFDKILDQGMPEELRLWMGMMGFQVVIDLHGQVVAVEQPSGPTPEE